VAKTIFTSEVQSLGAQPIATVGANKKIAFNVHPVSVLGNIAARAGKVGTNLNYLTCCILIRYNRNWVELSTCAPRIPCGSRAQRNDLQRISMHTAMVGHRHGE
jgi:hypothetical protein